MCSSDYKKKHLFNDILPITITKNNHLILLILMRAQINHVFYVYLGFEDTKIKQNSKLTDMNTI